MNFLSCAVANVPGVSKDETMRNKCLMVLETTQIPICCKREEEYFQKNTEKRAVEESWIELVEGEQEAKHS